MVDPDEMNKEEQDLVVRTLRPITRQQMDDIMKGTKDTINPQHYKNGEIECIDAIKAATVNHGTNDEFSTGSQPQYPPQPNVS